MLRQLLQTVKAEGMQIRMCRCKLKLLTIAAADAELMDPGEFRMILHPFIAPSHDTGVTELSPEIIISQVTVGVKLDHMNIRILLHYRPKGTEGHQVLSSQHKGQLPVL